MMLWGSDNTRKKDTTTRHHLSLFTSYFHKIKFRCSFFKQISLHWQQTQSSSWHHDPMNSLQVFLINVQELKHPKPLPCRPPTTHTVTVTKKKLLLRHRPGKRVEPKHILRQDSTTPKTTFLSYPWSRRKCISQDQVISTPATQTPTQVAAAPVNISLPTTGGGKRKREECAASLPPFKIQHLLPHDEPLTK